MDDEVLGHLVHFKKNGEPGEPYPLYVGETTIGTDPNADVRLKKKDMLHTLELIHCIIHVNNNGTASLINKSDKNPVKINGVVIRREQTIKDYDVFEIGNKKFQYSKVINTIGTKSTPSTSSHKRYTMFTSSAAKAISSANTPMGKTTPVVANVTRNTNTGSRKSGVGLKTQKNHNASFETQHLDKSVVKPDTRGPSVERPKTTSKIMTRRMLGSPAPLRRRLSLTVDKIHISKSPKATVSSRNLLLGDHVITPEADTLSKMKKNVPKCGSKLGYGLIKTPKTPKNNDVSKLAKNTPKSNKKVTPVKGSPFAKTPQSQKLSKKTPKSNKERKISLSKTPKSNKLSLPPQSVNRVKVALMEMAEENLISFDSPMLHDGHNISNRSETSTPALVLSKTPKKNSLAKTPLSSAKISKKTPKSARMSSRQNFTRTLEHLVEGSDKNLSSSSFLDRSNVHTPNCSNVTSEHFGNLSHISEKFESPSSSFGDLSNEEKVVTEKLQNRSRSLQKLDIVESSCDVDKSSESMDAADTEDPNVYTSRSKRSSINISGVSKIVDDVNTLTRLPVNRPKRSNRFSLGSSKDDNLQDAHKDSHIPRRASTSDAGEQGNIKELIHDVSNISNKSESSVDDANDLGVKTNHSISSRRSSLRKSNVENLNDQTSEQLVQDIPRRSNRSSLFTSHVETNDDIQPIELSVGNQSRDLNVTDLHKSYTKNREVTNSQELSISNRSRRSNRSSLHTSNVTYSANGGPEDADPERLTIPNSARRSHRSSVHEIRNNDEIQQGDASPTNTSQYLSEANRSRELSSKKSSRADTSRLSNRLSLQKSFTEQGCDKSLSINQLSRNAEMFLHKSPVSHEELDDSMSNTSKRSDRLSLRKSQSQEDVPTELSARNTSKTSTRSSLHKSYTSHPEENLAQEELSPGYTNSPDEASLDDSCTDVLQSSVVNETSIGNRSRRSRRSSLHKSHVGDQESLTAGDEQSHHTSMHSNRASLPVSESNAINASNRSTQSLICNSPTESQVNDIDSEEFATTNTSRLSNRSSQYKSGLEGENIPIFMGNKSRRSSRSSLYKENTEYLQNNEVDTPKKYGPDGEVSESTMRHELTQDGVIHDEDSGLTSTSRYSTRLSTHDRHSENPKDKEVENVSRCSNRTPNVSGRDTSKRLSTTINNEDPCDLPSETVQTPNLLSSSQYSMISEASTRSSGRVKKTPSKFKDSVCSFTPNASGRKTPQSKMENDYSTHDVLTPAAECRELAFDGTTSSTPHQRRLSRSLIKTPDINSKYNRSTSFIESTPIPKQARQHYRNSSLQILNGSDISKVSEKSIRDKSRSYSVISILDDPTTDEVEPSGRNTRSRSKLSTSASPLDSLIVNVDSDTDLPSEYFEHKRSNTPSVSSSVKNNSSYVNDSANFTTPENNISVIELSDDCLTPNSHLKRPSKSKSIVQASDQVDAYGTPKNTNQFDEGFKTPLNTPALFESLKKSVVRSRKRLNNSISLREENLNSSLDGTSSTSTDISEINILGETGLGQSSANVEMLPVMGTKRGRESSGSILRTAKKKKVEHHDENLPRESLNFDTSSEMTSEVSLDTSTESSSNISDVQGKRTNRGHSKLNRTCASLTEAKPKRSLARRSLQNVNICEYEYPALPNHQGIDHQSSSVSLSASEDLSDYLSEHTSSDTSLTTKGLPLSDDDFENSNISKKSIPKSPKQYKLLYNDLTDVRCIRNLKRTAREIKSPRNDLTDVRGVRNLMKTPKQLKSPHNDLMDVRGVKRLLKTPRLQNSPKNDLRDVRGVKRLVKTPRKQRSPKNDLTHVKGVKSLMRTPRVAKSPKNDLTAVRGIKQMFASPRIQKSPKNDLTNVAGIKKLLRSPKILKDPNNDLSDLRGVKQLYRSPKVMKEPHNDLTNIAGVKRMFLVEEATAKRQSMNISGIDVLFQTRENQSDIENHDLFSNIHRKPLRTYRGKSLSPKKPFEEGTIQRKTLGDIPVNSPHVEKWVEQQIHYTKKKVKRGTAGKAKSNKSEVIPQSASVTKELTVELTNLKESETEESAAQEEPVIQLKRTRTRNARVAVESPRSIVSRNRKLVVEIESMEPNNAVEKDELAQTVNSNVEKPQALKKRKGRQPAKSKTKESNVTIEEASLDSHITEINDPKEKPKSRQRQKLEEKPDTDYDKTKETDNSNDEPMPRHTRRRAGKTVKTPEVKNVRTRRGRKPANEIAVKVAEEESDIGESEPKLTRPRRAPKRANVKIADDTSADDSDGDDPDFQTQTAKTAANKRGIKSLDEEVKDGSRVRRGRKIVDDVSVKSFEEQSQTITSNNKPKRGNRRNNAETTSAQDTGCESSDNSGRAKRTRKPTTKVEVTTTEEDIEKPSRPTRQKRGQNMLEQSTPISTPIRATRRANKQEPSESVEPEVTHSRGRRKAVETTLEETPSKKATRTTRKNQMITDKVETPKSPPKKVIHQNKKGKPVIKSNVESDGVTDEVVQPVKRIRRKVLENVDEMAKVEEKTGSKQKEVEVQIIRKSTRTRKK